MATFNATGTKVQHATDALEAALSLRDKAQLIDLDLGIGIAVGPAVLSPGASDANVSVRGESTNLASRLQGVAAGGEILLSEEAHRRVEGRLKDLDLHAAARSSRSREWPDRCPPSGSVPPSRRARDSLPAPARGHRADRELSRGARGVQLA